MGTHFVYLLDAIEQVRHMEAMLPHTASQSPGLPSSRARDYYSDAPFSKEFDGDISLWKVYNLLTAANKSSYIDLFLSRASDASAFVGGLASSLEQGREHWFVSKDGVLQLSVRSFK